METGADTTVRSSKAPPALCLARACSRSRTSKVLDLAAASGAPPAPPLRSRVGVPFLWEEAPGKPKVVRPPQDMADSASTPPPPAPSATSMTVVSDGGAAGRGDGGGDRGDGARVCPVPPLKLPPRLQAAAAAAAAAEWSLSPETVLHGPYGGGKKLPRQLRRWESTASFRRKPGAGVSLWRKATAAARGKNHGRDHDAAALDASCRSPSSSSSSSSSLMSFLGDDHVRGAHRGQADDHEDTDDGEEGTKNTVRITRFRRNSSLPSITTSHLWANIRRSVKQITPWS
ncbi:hypothetical protein GUJ93_ZPchr0008g13608 [Zizania palustris]|uniref:Uncharacterized protein n=1 Tax=Zizania palustris TaxID=103762 RepID=A0A8J5RHA0_ZIZPA|nr:hypothetical protein GUJ93_ZPchr0008g13608 [Zizania palustris]